MTAPTQVRERLREIRRSVECDRYNGSIGLGLGAGVVDDRAWLLARVEELEAALRPFADAFATQVETTPDGARRDWNARMPGEWACPVTVTMEDGRRARRALSPDSEGGPL